MSAHLQIKLLAGVFVDIYLFYLEKQPSWVNIQSIFLDLSTAPNHQKETSDSSQIPSLLTFTWEMTYQHKYQPITEVMKPINPLRDKRAPDLNPLLQPVRPSYYSYISLISPLPWMFRPVIDPVPLITVLLLDLRGSWNCSVVALDSKEPRSLPGLEVLSFLFLSLSLLAYYRAICIQGGASLFS